MKKVFIVTDSTADLPKELCDVYNITVVPLKVVFNGFGPLLDGVDIDSEQFYHRLVEKRELSVTSQPTPAEFAATYQRLHAKGGSIISIHISSAMSGTCQSARMGKDMVPDADIEVIDSRSVSMGLGQLVLAVACAACAGRSKQELLEIVQRLIPKMNVFFFVDSLDYLARGGRIGKAQAFLGTILNIKPLLFLKDGIVHPYEKIRGRTKAMNRLIQVVGEKTGGKPIKCSLVHSNDPEGIKQLRQKIMAKLNCDEPIISTLGAVVGTHSGPGTLGVTFYIHDE
ncbi:MAG: DegV family protein [Desulfotomaculaceae bacterium]|nr:DegV family protein [Desulfotomaculaceae bacterium]